MSRIITQDDLYMTYQHVMNFQIRVEVFDQYFNYIDSMDCALLSGTFNMDANSDVRRTASFVISPNVRSKISLLIEEDSLIWINRNVVLKVGIDNHRTGEVVWYKLGTFVIMTYSSTYDAVTNQLTINCRDYMARLDGTKNGELGALITSFPAYKEFYSTESTGGTDCYYFKKNQVSYANNIYTVVSPIHTDYVIGDYVVLQMPATNEGEAQFQWNNLEARDIYDIQTGRKVEAGIMKADNNYAFRFDKDRKITLTSRIPIEKVVDGVPIAYFIIRDAMITALKRLGGFKDYNIDEDIGEFLAMPQYNEDYVKYRKENPLWNNIPYDLEFSVGDNVLSIITTLRDLYPNYETYFNEDGVFCCNMVPSQYDDDIYLHDDYLQEILISENFDIDTSSIRNVCEVWGPSLEVDFTAKSCTYNSSNATYTIDIDEYGDTEFNGDKIAVTIDSVNGANAKIAIHTKYTEYEGGSTVEKEKTFEALEIYDEMTDKPLAADFLEISTTYVFKIKTKLINGTTSKKYIYFQSEYQPQAMDVLTDGSVSSDTWTCADGTVTNVWSKKYFADKYGCQERNIHFTVDETSALTIQKLGEVLGVKSGGEYDNILSDQRALARATYENWKSARLVDTITLTTKLCLFVDVNKKVEYKRHDKDEAEQYVITSVSHDLAGGTSTLGLSHFYPLYVDAQ